MGAAVGVVPVGRWQPIVLLCDGGLVEHGWPHGWLGVGFMAPRPGTLPGSSPWTGNKKEGFRWRVLVPTNVCRRDQCEPVDKWQGDPHWCRRLYSVGRSSHNWYRPPCAPKAVVVGAAGLRFVSCAWRRGRLAECPPKVRVAEQHTRAAAECGARSPPCAVARSKARETHLPNRGPVSLHAGVVQLRCRQVWFKCHCPGPMLHFTFGRAPPCMRTTSSSMPFFPASTAIWSVTICSLSSKT